jgi:hypothetical protein
MIRVMNWKGCTKKKGGYYLGKGKVKDEVVPVLNQAPRHEDVLGE